MEVKARTWDAEVAPSTLLDVLLLEHGVEHRVDLVLHAQHDEGLALLHGELELVLNFWIEELHGGRRGR